MALKVFTDILKSMEKTGCLYYEGISPLRAIYRIGDFGLSKH